MSSSYPPNPYAESTPVVVPGVDRSDRHRVWQLVLGIAAFFLAQFLMTLALGFFAVFELGPAAVRELGGNFTAFPPWAMLLAMIIGSIAIVVFHLLIVRFVAKSPGLTLSGSNKVAEFGIGIAVGIVLMSLSVGVIALFGGYRITGVEIGPGLLLGLAVGIGPAFMEEVLFRGYLMRLFDAWFGSYWALGLTAALFGLVHISNPDATAWGAIAITFEAGILLGAAYLVTRRLWMAIGIHLAWNFMQGGVFSSAVSGTGQSHGLFTAEFAGPDWLTGGAMGIEGSVVTVIICTVAGFIMLGVADRQGHILPSVRKEHKGLHTTAN